MTNKPFECARRFAVPKVAFVITIFILLLLLIAEAIVPTLIRSSYEGNGPDRLNQFFASRKATRSLEHYLHHWQTWRNAIPLSCLAWFVITISIEISIRNVKSKWFLICYSAVFLGLTNISGPHQDYWSYIEIWNETVEGHDPWWIQSNYGRILNAYGPAFLLFAPLAYITPLLPKILFSCSFLFYAVILIRTVESNSSTALKRIVWAFLLCPFVWVEIPLFGHFDVLVSLSLVLALAAFDQSQELRSGFFIGLGFLLKFIPIFAAPFMTLDTRERRFTIHWKFAIQFIVTSLGAIVVIWPIWGESVLRPFTFASNRVSVGISIWRYLRGPLTPWALAGWPLVNLDRYSKYAIIVGIAIAGAIHLQRRAHPIHSALVSMLITMTLYQTGNPQFQMVPILMIPYWYWKFQATIRIRPKLRWALALYVFWMSCVTLLHVAFGTIESPMWTYGVPSDWLGLFTFCIQSFLIANLVKMMGRENL